MSRLWELIKSFFAWLFLDKPRDITRGLKEGAEEVRDATEEVYKETKEEVSEWAGRVKKVAEELGSLVVSSEVLKSNQSKPYNRKNKNVEYYPKGSVDLDETIHPVKAKKKTTKKAKKTTKKVAKKPVKKTKKAAKKSARAPKKTK